MMTNLFYYRKRIKQNSGKNLEQMTMLWGVNLKRD